MTSEYSIPSLKSTSTNYPFFETALRRHLDGIAELRIIDSSYRLPTKTVTARSLNPFWIEPAVLTAPTSATLTPSPSEDPNLAPHPTVATKPVQQWITTTTTVTNEIVSTYSPGLDKAGGAKEIPFQILNSQMISMFSRLLDKTLHHLLVVPRGVNPLGAAAAVFKSIKTHFSCSAWMSKDFLIRKWEDIRECQDPEVTYNLLLEVNQECSEAGSPYSEFQVASKYVHLLQTADDRAYIHLLTELARMGENCNILHLWHIAQVTWNQIKIVNKRTSPPSQHLGMNAQTQPRRQCLWCTGGGHSAERCYAKDPINLTKFPHISWGSAGATDFMKQKYHKKFTQEEATAMVRSTQAAGQHHRASLAWTPPPIFNAAPSEEASTSSTDLPRQQGRYKRSVPAEPEIAMLAQTVSDGMPHVNNLW
jgi:hypothetical protein